MSTNVATPIKGSRMTRWQRIAKSAPIVISLFALEVSFFSLIFSQLLPARIQVHLSEFVYVGDRGGNLEFHLNLTFTNSGAALGVVGKVALLIQPPGKSDGYLLQAEYFERLSQIGS